MTDNHRAPDGADAPPAGGPPADKPEPQGVQEFRRRALALGFGIITLSVLALLVAIYAQSRDRSSGAGRSPSSSSPLHRQTLRLVGLRPTLAAAISTLVSPVMMITAALLWTALHRARRRLQAELASVRPA